MTNQIIDHLLTRRSVSANSLGDPGPNGVEIEQNCRGGRARPRPQEARSLALSVVSGDARGAFGEVLAETCKREERDPSQFRLEMETQRFMRAPLVIAVISRVVKSAPVPEWEQVLSAGAACQNLLLAATALGFGAQWITEWYGYSPGVRAALKLADNERVVGFVYIGTTKEKPEERERPVLADIVQPWRP